jgi:RNA polymerase sigma-70 factor, ECF subfamily
MIATEMAPTYTEFAGNNDDLLLARRICAGDGGAGEVLFGRYASRMLATARRFLRCQEECADAVQDAFLAALRAMPSFNGTAQLGTWLHRILANVCLTRLRKKQRHAFVPLDDLLPTVEESCEDQPELRLTRVEVCEQVRECIDRLPTPYRTVVLLRDIEELDTDETAARLGTNQAVVKTRLHRARRALRSLLEASQA